MIPRPCRREVPEHPVRTFARCAPGARSYAVRIKGSDGRLLSLLLGARRHSALVKDVLPFQALSVTVRAKGGPNLLAGPPANGRSAVVKAKTRRRARHR